MNTTTTTAAAITKNGITEISQQLLFGSYKLWTLSQVSVINFICVLVAVIIWYHIWVKNLGVEIPIEKNIEGLDKRHLFYTTRSLSILIEFFKGMLTTFKRDYWSTQCGQDAYLYLLFQRKLMKLTFFLGITSLVVSFTLNLFLTSTRQEWVEQSTLGYKVENEITAWVHATLGIVFSIAAFYTIFEMREEAKQLYTDNQREKCRIKDFEWLKARTLHVRGLVGKDRRGDMLRNELNMMLQQVNGKVLDVVVIPDFQQLFDMETEKKELEDLHLLVNTHGTPGCFTRCCFGLLWTNGDLRKTAVQERLKILDANIEREIERPFMSSGHAFVVLDSVKSLNFCLKQSKITPTYAWKIAKIGIKESVQQFFSTANSRTLRSISQRQTFNKFEDEDLEIAQHAYRDKVDLMFVMSHASDPLDIIWNNMGGTRGLYIFRMVFFNILVLAVVLFLSTPAAIYSSFKVIQLSGTQPLDLDHLTAKLGQNKEALWGWGPLISTFIPPLVIIFINNCLLFMFDFFAFWEKQITHSKYQFSIFNKAYIYLALNMMIIPAVTLTSQSKSVLKVFSENDYNLVSLLSQFYMNKDSGVFFASMLIQNACLSTCINLVRPGDIILAFFSPWLAHYRRKYLNDSQPWRRRESMVFLYGFYYAQQLAIFSIVIVYASFVPIISVTGFIFFAMRHIVDSYNLLTVNRKEIDSSSQMFQKILLTSQLAILLLQLCLSCYLWTMSYQACSSLLMLTFALSSVVVYLSNREPLLYIDESMTEINNEIVDLQSVINNQSEMFTSEGRKEEAKEEEEVKDVEVEYQEVITENSPLYAPITKWRREYSHPLTICGSRSFQSEKKEKVSKDLNNIANKLIIQEPDIKIEDNEPKTGINDPRQHQSVRDSASTSESGFHSRFNVYKRQQQQN